MCVLLSPFCPVALCQRLHSREFVILCCTNGRKVLPFKLLAAVTAGITPWKELQQEEGILALLRCVGCRTMRACLSLGLCFPKCQRDLGTACTFPKSGEPV